MSSYPGPKDLPAVESVTGSARYIRVLTLFSKCSSQADDGAEARTE